MARFANLPARAQIHAMIRRRTLIILIVALAAKDAGAQGPLQYAPQGEPDIQRVEAYLNGIHTLKARFLQVAPSGATSEGTVWLERPGRMRFQYDPPSALVLVAGHGFVVFRDFAINQTTYIPIGRTPLGILLAEHITLTGDVTVTAIQRQPGQIQLGLVRTAAPSEGSLILAFADAPLTLRQWTVIDAQRQETRVTLYNVELGGTFDQRLFNVAALQATPDGGNR
jgi:outer membrane lipoprotein-sorting protein